MSRTLLFFYILVAYVFLQFTWWAYLLIDLNSEVFQYRIMLLEKQHADPAVLFSEKELFYLQLKKRWMMVLGEGAVFLALLIYGIHRTRTAFSREVELARQQKNFLLSITHEFKSPLAAIKLNLQTIQKRNLPAVQQEDIVGKALMETDRINDLIENALFAARIESHNYDHYVEPINLSEFVHKTVSDFSERPDQDHTIRHVISPAIQIKGDKMALASMMNNLLENAQKYSSPGSAIEITLIKSGNEAILTLKDEGIGIAESERKRIFEKFYRVGNEETRKFKGTGLGLYIVYHVVNLHKAKIEVKANEPKGTVFEIRFPLG